MLQWLVLSPQGRGFQAWSFCMCSLHVRPVIHGCQCGCKWLFSLCGPVVNSPQCHFRQLGQTPAPQMLEKMDGWIKCPLITADICCVKARKVCLVRVRSEAPALRSYPCTAPAKTLGPGLSHVRLPAGSISHAERPLCVTALQAAQCRQRLPTSPLPLPPH